MLGATQLSNVDSARAYFDKVSVKGYVKSEADVAILDAFEKAGVTKASDVTDASFTKATETLRITASKLRAAMGGCPMAGGMIKAQAAQQ